LTDEIKESPVPVIVDSRERAPFKFSDRCSVTVAGLKSGDYSIQNLENRVAIERKSLPDLIGSLTTSRARFTRELERLSSYEFAAVVIEASYDDVVEGRYEYSRAHPNAIMGSVIACCYRYVPFFFAGDREMAGRLTEALLRRAWLDELRGCGATA
jgi:ERCC4-type nuclease